MNIQFSLGKIQETLNQAAELAKSQKEVTDFTPVTFLPPGEHVVKFFFDPTSEVIRYFIMHRSGKAKTLCPKFVKNDPLVPEECLIDFLASDKGLNRWKELGARKQCMIYGKLISTNKPGDYWKPGNSYAIIGNQRLWKAVTSLLGLVDKSKEAQAYIMNMLTPNLNGASCAVNVLPGSGGSVNINSIPGAVDPVFTEPPVWWKPLNEIYISNVFSLNDYTATLKATISEYKAEIVEKGLHVENPTINKLLQEVLDEEQNKPVNSKSENKKEEKKEEPILSSSSEEPKTDSSTCSRFGSYDPSNPDCIVCKNNVTCMEKSLG